MLISWAAAAPCDSGARPMMRVNLKLKNLNTVSLAIGKIRVGNKKPAQKNPPKKTHLKAVFLGFIGFF
jgi:hypothetical protein